MRSALVALVLLSGCCTTDHDYLATQVRELRKDTISLKAHVGDPAFVAEQLDSHAVELGLIERLLVGDE